MIIVKMQSKCEIFIFNEWISKNSNEFNWESTELINYWLLASNGSFYAKFSTKPKEKKRKEKEENFQIPCLVFFSRLFFFQSKSKKLYKKCLEVSLFVHHPFHDNENKFFNMSTRMFSRIYIYWANFLWE